jgi:hypothetical protein
MLNRKLSRVLAGVAGLALLTPSRGLAQDPSYARTLYSLCDALVPTQIVDPKDANYGALICPSTNPQEHPLHSRAAEAAYPFAVAYQHTGSIRYRDAAIRVVDWLITKQQANGAWGEDWPLNNGWTGTTADQLISMAGAYPILSPALSDREKASWTRSMAMAADYIAAHFPMGGNINYSPTGAVALRLAHDVIDRAPDLWLAKGDALVETTLSGENADHLLVGEGGGVDLGYNISQSIGYLALFGILKHDETIVARAAGMLRAHSAFVYPNGTVDNSWGTRSFKWDYESGTKTAPGIYFTFALLADRDPAFARLGKLCLGYLTDHGMDHGWVIYGPDASKHPSSNPPCNYPTFARAQSIALAIEYGREAPVPAREAEPPPPWHRSFPTVNVTVVRTAHLMATLSAYGEYRRYGRDLVPRGGSITNLWLDDFAGAGMFQTSSATVYHRPEPAHMPNEKALLTLTPRIECVRDGAYYTNLYETAAKLTVVDEADDIKVTASGELRDGSGRTSGIAYTLTHRFYSDRIQKEFLIRSPQAQLIRIVEPIVRADGVSFERSGDDRVLIKQPAGPTWACQVTQHTAACTLSTGNDAEKYWSPFPAIECQPIAAEFVTPGDMQESSVTLAFGPTK